MVDHPLSSPLALPDGVGMTACATDADCPAAQHCFDIPDNQDGNPKECRASYIARLHYTSFGANQKFVAGNLVSVCVEIEHSWLRDLRIDLVAPSGEIVQLQRMLGQSGDEIYLGQANDCDSDAHPVPGIGAMYCWAPSATRPAMLDYANSGGAMVSVATCNGGVAVELPPDTYAAADPWTNLVGAMMNGDWQLRITDLWPIDNGYIFQWSITWATSAVTNCSGPIIE
jgi:subtilisin-like proprotein convertase family protein